MSELKTLKDFKTNCGDEFELIRFDELKAEAIKWVMKYKNSKEKVTLLHEDKAAEIFMNFFNITEEDLKDD